MRHFSAKSQFHPILSFPAGYNHEENIYLKDISCRVVIHSAQLMKITYASTHRWIRPVTENFLEYLSKKDQKALLHTLNFAGSGNVRHEITRLDEDFLSRFLPLYEA